jgi:outer membrane protein assembly factor BamD
MSRRSPLIFLLSVLLLVSAACTNKKVNNPLANVGSKQPDKVLFDRAMDMMKHNRFDQARMILQTLINTYPDSEFIARAKLAVADSWYAEGGSTALTQAEVEYRDFETFFPNMPEAAEAQLKIANIHYQQMEKPDRDFTHAMRAEQEYRQLIQQYPDSKLVPEAKQRLLEVQEVLAQREFGIGRFYYIRMSYAAAIARLRTLVDRYPLFSQADEALYMLGESYEGQIALTRASKTPETMKAKLIQELTKNASDAYSRILTRYPVMARAEDARRRLEALHQPVPQPTKEALALNRKEEESRRSMGMFGHLMGGFTRHPDVAQATKVGDPTITDTQTVSASDVITEESRVMSSAAAGGEHKVSVETVTGTGAPPAGEPTPRSDTPAPEAAPQPRTAPTPKSGSNSTVTADTPANAAQVDPNAPAQPQNPGIGELRPNVSDTGSAGDGSAPTPPPAQVNQLDPGASSQSGEAASAPTDASSSASQSSSSSSTAGQASTSNSNDDQTSSSSKKKKKRKILPF